MKLFDAHNHLQDDRFYGEQAELIEECRKSNIFRMVVNGSCERDWRLVRSLAETYEEIIPAFGCHPWYLGEASADWKDKLTELLSLPGSTIGEIGLDRWKPGLDFELQQKFFIEQLAIAHERNLPATIHCLKAWGPLLDVLESTPLPERGFLVHSYSGSVEMIAPLTKLGAYFSCAGNYLASGKENKLAVFSSVPIERLLIESDAPDQNLPPEKEVFQLLDRNTQRRINHPANLAQTYRALAEQHRLPLEEFAEQIETNFHRLFTQT